MDKKEYQKLYKKHHYKTTRKIVTFPLLNEDYEILKARSQMFGLTSNSFSKEILLNFLHSQQNNFISPQEQKRLAEFIHISRGIANNINQLAHSSNIGEYIDINILAKHLKRYEDEFKAFITKR